MNSTGDEQANNNKKKQQNRKLEIKQRRRKREKNINTKKKQIIKLYKVGGAYSSAYISSHSTVILISCLVKALNPLSNFIQSNKNKHSSLIFAHFHPILFWFFFCSRIRINETSVPA